MWTVGFVGGPVDGFVMEVVNLRELAKEHLMTIENAPPKLACYLNPARVYQYKLCGAQYHYTGAATLAVSS
jgi:hypothetical protein